MSDNNNGLWLPPGFVLGRVALVQDKKLHADPAPAQSRGLYPGVCPVQGILLL